jgi:hypothetical protein
MSAWTPSMPRIGLPLPIGPPQGPSAPIFSTRFKSRLGEPGDHFLILQFKSALYKCMLVH